MRRGPQPKPVAGPQPKPQAGPQRPAPTQANSSLRHSDSDEDDDQDPPQVRGTEASTRAAPAACLRPPGTGPVQAARTSFATSLRERDHVKTSFLSLCTLAHLPAQDGPVTRSWSRTARNSARTSLAAGLFGCLPARGWRAPDRRGAAPTAWLLLFLEQHADWEVCRGLRTASKASRAWLLCSAPKAKLHLDTTDAPQLDVWVAQLTRDCEVLLARGTLCTRLHIVVHPDKEAESAAVLSALDGHIPAITDIQIEDRSLKGPCAAYAQVMQRTVSANPQLRSLTLNPFHPSISPPTNLPQLRHLIMRLPCNSPQQTHDDCLRSCAAHLPQLSSLHLDYFPHNGPPSWPLLFNAASTTHTLTTLDIKHTLDDALLKLLLQHAAALEQLSVRGVRLQADYSHRQWGVRSLYWGSGQQGGDDLAHLPTCSKGVVTVPMSYLHLLIKGAEGLSPATLRRLSEWLFTANVVRVQPAPGLPAADRPAALRNTLRQLCGGLRVARDPEDELPEGSTEAAKVHLRFPGWGGDVENLKAYLHCFPTYTEIGLRPIPETRHARIKRLTDEVLVVSLLAAPQLRRLSARRLALQSDLHAGAVWPWELLNAYAFDVAQLLRLPLPGGEGAPRKVTCQFLCLPSDMFQVDVQALCARLQHFEWDVSEHSGDCDHELRIVLECPADSAAQAATLRAQCTALQAVRLSRPQYAVVVLPHWPLSHQNIRELSGLPAWSSLLDLSMCHWPLDGVARRALAQHVPTAYIGWFIPGSDHDEWSAVQDSVAVALSEHRAARDLSPIALLLVGYQYGPRKQGKHVLLIRESARHKLQEGGSNAVWRGAKHCSYKDSYSQFWERVPRID